MTISLTPELEQFIEDQVKAGRYATAEEAVAAGVARLMLDPAAEELDPETAAAIEHADAQCDRGESMPLDEAFAKLRRKHLGR